MGDRLLGPARPQHLQRLVETLAALLARHPESLLLVRIGHAESEGRQQPSVREAIEGRQLLGQHHRVATRKHHDAHAELQTLGTAGGVGHAHQRIGRLAPDAFAQPEAVEAQRLERIDHPAEPVVVQGRANAEAVTDTNLHRRTIPSMTSAVRGTADTNGEWSVSSTTVSVHRAAMIR